MTTTPTTTTHSMLRLDIPTGRGFPEFRAAFESAVPVVDAERVEEIVASRASWSEVERAAAENAPHGFMRYATVDTTPVMALAGHSTPAVEYLVGNHVLAERMVRHHPDALLYAPLRVLVRADDDARAVVVLDQPSTVFAGLGRAEIDVVGAELDSMLAELLRALDVAVPDQLLAPG